MSALLSLRSDYFEYKDGQKSVPSVDSQFPVEMLSRDFTKYVRRIDIDQILETSKVTRLCFQFHARFICCCYCAEWGNFLATF